MKNYKHFNNKFFLTLLVLTSTIFGDNILNNGDDKQKKVEAKNEVSEATKNSESYKGSYFNRKNNNPKKIKKEFKELTLDELETNKNAELKSRRPNKETMVRYVERMIAICKDQGKICELRLELGDLYFDLELYDKAEKNYSEFITSYPGNAKSEYAFYRAINSMYNKTNIPERDQTETRETIKLAKQFLAKDSYTKYRAGVIWIMEQCNKKLLDAEINVFNFYLKNKKIKSAEKRLEYIKKEFLNNANNKVQKDLIEDLEEQILAIKEKRHYVPNYQRKHQEIESQKKRKRSYAERF